MHKIDTRFGIPVTLTWERESGDVTIRYERVARQGGAMHAEGRFSILREGVVTAEVYDNEGRPYWDLQREAQQVFGVDVVTALCHYTTVPQAAAFNAQFI